MSSGDIFGCRNCADGDGLLAAASDDVVSVAELAAAEVQRHLRRKGWETSIEILES